MPELQRLAQTVDQSLEAAKKLKLETVSFLLKMASLEISVQLEAKNSKKEERRRA